MEKKWKSFGNVLPSNDKECFYCGGRLWMGNRTTDHVLPKSKGGIRSNDNKVFCCVRCNQLKKDFDVVDFKGMVKFLLNEIEKEHKERTDYYRSIIERVDKLIKSKNGKVSESIQQDKQRDSEDRS